MSGVRIPPSLPFFSKNNSSLDESGRTIPLRNQDTQVFIPVPYRSVSNVHIGNDRNRPRHPNHIFDRYVAACLINTLQHAKKQLNLLLISNARKNADYMDRWQAMKVFVKVAEAESFADAGRQLHMSPPAVTRTVSALEDIIGSRLLTRTTRSVKLTEAGSRYFADCQRLLADLAEAEAAAAGAYGKPTGTLTVTASVLFGKMFVLPIMTEYLDFYPEVIGRSLFVDRVVSIVDEGVDVAIRIGHLPDSGFTATRVGQVKRVVCGSPEYFEKHGAPTVPSDLSRHRIIATTSAWASLEWRFGVEQKSAVHVNPRLFCNTNEAAIAAAVQGWGLTRILSYQIAPYLESGELQTILSDYDEEALPIHVVHPDGRQASAKVRSFIDFAVARLRANRHFN